MLQKELERLKFINIYVIDLSVENPKNVTLGSLKLSSQSIPVGTPLSVDVTVSAVGSEEIQQTVEILATNAAGELVTQGKRSVRIKPEQKVEESFQLTDLAQPFSQGEVRLGTGDPLDVDNRRYFTVGTKLPPRILIVSGQKDDGFYLKEALAPVRFEKLGRAPFRVDQKTTPWLKEHLQDLTHYAVVCLVNVADPTDAEWNALADYTDQGGGLAIFLGSEKIETSAYNSPTAQSLVPAELMATRTFDPPEFLNVTAKDQGEHPLFKRLSSWKAMPCSRNGPCLNAGTSSRRTTPPSPRGTRKTITRPPRRRFWNASTARAAW